MADIKTDISVNRIRMTIPSVTSAIDKEVFVATTGVAASSGGNAVGVLEDDVLALGAACVVTHGVVRVKAAGVVTAGSRVQVGTDGKALLFDAGIKVGTAWDSATTVNDIVRVSIP